MKDPVKCPHCSGEISYSYVAKAADASRMRFALKPMPGEFMTAQVIGNSLAAFGDLLIASGKQLGANTVVLVEKMENGLDPGSIDIHLLAARGPAFDERKKRMKKAKEAKP